MVQTGSEWYNIEEFENAEASFSKCMPCAATWKISLAQARCSEQETEELAEDLFGLLSQRMVTAWQLGIQVCSPWLSNIFL